jgi:putative transposase
MRRAYVFRLRPTARQHIALSMCVQSHRELYNTALQERRDGWSHSKTRITYGDQSAQLTEIRAVRPDLGVVVLQSAGHAAPTRQVIPRVLPPGQRRPESRLPKFKGHPRFDSVEWPKDGDGARWLPEAARVYLQGIGQDKVTMHHQVLGRVKTIQIKRQDRRWILVLSCDDVPAIGLAAIGRHVGVGVGVATTSDGEHIDTRAGAGRRLPG